MSTLRFGADEYDSDLVQERLRTIGVAVAILLVMMAAEILILRSIFKIQIKDQKILKFMGMVHKIDRQDQLYGDASIQYYCYYRGRGSDECSWNLCAGAACYALLL